MKKKLAFLMVLGVISLVGCGGEQEKNLETYPSVEVIEPTSAEAEEIVTGSSGNKVFFVMCNKSLEE